MLSIDHLTKHFGGLPALNDVSFDCPAGRITTLIGPNGAGKSTLINCVTGVLVPDKGSVRLEGTEIGREPSYRIPYHGIARTFQNLALFPRLSVLENVLSGLTVEAETGFLKSIFRPPATRNHERRLRLKAMEMLDRFVLAGKADWPVGELSYGDRKRVEMARALVSGPRILFLDEPVAGLNAEESAAIGEEICRLRNLGLTILLVEHDMDLVMAVSDGIVVLDSGELIAQGSPEEIRHNPKVIEAYLGRMSVTA
ncbi:MAG: ABC transporter ATP-binding protein [Deltaproteobacteria bacterium]|nr:ABC transporter ATP-binding protein [Deltaproteobacteria bacterium]